MRRTETKRPDGSTEPFSPLETGHHLELPEYFRRYEAMPDIRGVELIEGVVYLPGRVRIDHGEAHANLAGVLGTYKIYTPGLQGCIGPTIKLDRCNCPEPDVVLRIDPEYGGQSGTDDGYIIGAPEMIGEIAATSVSRELHTKKAAYQRAGVREYIVWRVREKAIDWFVLREGRFQNLDSDTSGIVRSPFYAGLWIDVAALVEGELDRVLAVLRAGIASPEHAAFVTSLEAKRTIISSVSS